MRPFLLLCCLVFITGPAANASATTFEVSIVDDQFVPDSLQIAVGDSVHWTNNGAEVHTVTSGDECTADGAFDSGALAPGADFGHMFTSAGEFYYFCSFHCAVGMEGEIEVEEETPVKPITWGRLRSLYH